MDQFWQLVTSVGFREVSSTVILTGVVLAILTDRLVTRRRLLDAQKERDAWKNALNVSEAARASLNQENFKLMESSRISVQFYRDFLPAVTGKTIPQPEQRSDEST